MLETPAFRSCSSSLARARAAPQQRSRARRSRAGAERVVALLKGEAQPADIFTPAFLAQVPDAQVRAVVQQFAAQYGAVRGLGGIDAASPQIGTIHVRYERAVVHMDLAVEPQPPHLISGLLLTGADMRGDTWRRCSASSAPCPARLSFAVARLGDGAPASSPAARAGPAAGDRLDLQALHPRRTEPPGAGRAAALERRRRRSTAARSPAARSPAWPRGAPVTLHTLASLMISISDNSATDILLHAARPRECRADDGARSGVARRRPATGRLLSTLELAADQDRRRRPPSTSGSRPTRRRGGACSRNDYAGDRPVAGSTSRRFAGNPVRIDSVEWFASAADLVRAMDWLRRQCATRPPRRSSAINPGPAPQARGDLRLCRLQGRLGAGRRQPHLSGPDPRRRLVCGQRQLEQSGRAGRRGPASPALMARAVQLLR